MPQLLMAMLQKPDEFTTTTCIDEKDSIGRTPLSWAARKGHYVIVKLLLEKGADIEAKDDIGWTPLLLAAEYEREAVVKLLLEKGANLESEYQTG